MIPKPYKQMHEKHPALMQAYEAFGEATRKAGPLSAREVALVKLAISIGAGLEGAAHYLLPPSQHAREYRTRANAADA